MRELIKRVFENWVEMRWLKEIDRSIASYKKAQEKAFRKHHVMRALVDRYNEIYDKNLWSAEYARKVN